MTDRAAEQAKYTTAYQDPAYRMGKFRRQVLQHWLAEQVSAGPVERYLDVGCGRGESLDIASNLGIGERWGFETIAVADNEGWKRQIGGHCWDVIEGVHALDFVADGWADLVTCLDVLEHVLEPDSIAGLGELVRITKGRLLVSVAWHSSVWNGVELHVNRHDADWWLAQLNGVTAKLGGTASAYLPPAELGTGPAASAWFEVVR